MIFRRAPACAIWAAPAQRSGALRANLSVARARSRGRLPAAALARRPPEQLAAATHLLRRSRSGDRRDRGAYREASPGHAGRLSRRRQDPPLVASRRQSLDGSGDGVWFIELAPLASGEYIPSTVAQALGLTLRIGRRSGGEPRARAQGKTRAARFRQLRASGRAGRARHLRHPARRSQYHGPDIEPSRARRCRRSDVPGAVAESSASRSRCSSSARLPRAIRFRSPTRMRRPSPIFAGGSTALRWRSSWPLRA